MKKNMRKITLLLSLLMILSTLSFALTGCTGEGQGNGDKETSTGTVTEAPTEPETSPSTEGSGSNETEPDTDSKKTDYTVKVTTIGGRAIPQLTFYIYSGEDLVTYGQTNSEGIGTVSLEPSDSYTIELSANSLEGYDVADRYEFNGNSADIVLTSFVIEDSDLTGVQYQLGDIIRDFTVTTTDGSTFTLSEALKDKKGVLINFWFSTCSPCITEFPYMQSAYEKFSDDIAIIALNSYAGDNEIAVKNFKESMGLTFPVAKDYSPLYNAFTTLVLSTYGQTGYPTSIFVDRYGTICLVELGGLTSEKPFIAAFEHFSADNYQQQLLESIDKLTPTEKPNVEMPSSDEIGAALNAQGFNAIYTPETDTSDAEYSWPFVTGTKDGKTCIYPSNSYKDSSFATIHAEVELKKDQALAIDWFASCEIGVDILYVLVDGKDIYQISGTSEAWTTCYPFVAVEDGTYKVSFIYLKDDTTDTGEDRVYLTNFRSVPASAIDSATYIPRQAATKPNANGLGYKSYVTAVYNETDGYYHVENANGPLLLVNLMGSTQLSKTSLNDLGYNGKLVDSNGDIYEILIDYCNYSINGTMYGYSPVTDELKGLLERAAELTGFERGNPDQWLQACVYYDAYGTDKQLEDPVKGVAFFAAFDTVLSTETEEIFNTVVYDGRVIMPRGLKYKFVPEKSGVYIIRSQSKDEVNGWIFDENGEIIHTAETVDRPYTGVAIDTTNVTMIEYLEAGKTYYIDIAYYDIYGEGTFTFTVHYIAETYEHFHLASPGYFTYHESGSGQINETIAGGINVKLGDDGYYYELRDDGTLGSLVYADFKYSTGIFTHSVLQMIEIGGFNFSTSETDEIVIAKLKELGGDVDACRAYYKDLWGESYAEWEEIYKLEEVLAGKYHGSGEDYTDEMRAYVEKMIAASEEAPELEGCVPVDEELAGMLQLIIDKYSFKGVRNAWTKLCYYYKALNETYH
ncbi:MAG: redoxin domain-containing protein [Ruminococcaceae bacterium]|nr:redoxin domain-containing protein [Oscillospiraceae bacterium]